ncbi:hypothetical protein ACFFUO_08195 [Vibrio artabrorum]|uniref:3-demethylubiquinone-9 3-methyltransferase n=1 Tax=Vibrio artabrorum TaxID=446374 RepID=A0ABT8CJ90_9VIBR|nr:hypothetical protein [Vibrio artabrorum]MDN3701508.1 hypothetical protein [Vibrio artabrorum]
MDKVILNLKKEFHTHVQSDNWAEKYSAKSSISTLTPEELAELENAWVQLVIWKRTQTS